MTWLSEHKLLWARQLTAWSYSTFVSIVSAPFLAIARVVDRAQDGDNEWPKN